MGTYNRRGIQDYSGNYFQFYGVPYFGVCSTAAVTQIKQVTISDCGSNLLTNGTRVIVKFNYAQNYDGIPYLKVNNTKIDYVVVKAKDNDYYLHHNFNKKSNVAGWVFADYHNKFDGSDRNIVIYGHNMKNGTMFGTLKKTFKKEWYKNTDNHIITLVTEQGTLKYQVFSVYSIPVEDYYINTKFSSDNDFYKFIKTLKSRSIHNFKVDVNKTDKIFFVKSGYR